MFGGANDDYGALSVSEIIDGADNRTMVCVLIETGRGVGRSPYRCCVGGHGPSGTGSRPRGRRRLVLCINVCPVDNRGESFRQPEYYAARDLSPIHPEQPDCLRRFVGA